jgi:hypothetical protein
MYFQDCKTLDQAKTLFRTLCHKLHPDKGGKASEFIKMQTEFKAFKPSVSYDSDKDFNYETFYNLVSLFDGLQGIKISFVGIFIWLEDIDKGATYNQREAIKSIIIDKYNHARFAGKKKAWYFSPVDYTQKFRSKKTLEQVKSTWGCKSFQSKSNLQLN